MKNTLLKITAVLAIIFLIGACSTDETSVKNDAQQNGTLLAKGSIWEGALGTVNSVGQTKFAVNKNLLLADFESILADQGEPTDLTDIFFELKKNETDPDDQTYVLIGTNGGGTSIGVMLKAVGASSLYLDDANFSSVSEGFTSTTCRGCATGCNMAFIRLQGKKVFYCNENGCGEFCTKNESN
ncbi:hypothetical protein [Flavobacterium psychrotrophum]|uniref:hypothetical protein n=1 Tax=Flavobacterium psychrotrophum TaxID=2294119 RepID=UPI000E315AEF|nr:hypothetical protein [Flavobacterium psychrotrophum]